MRADEPNRERLVLGIDPGASGAAAMICVRSGRDTATLQRVVGAEALLVIGALVQQANLVVIEGQQASPNMGRGSAYQLGVGVGRIEGVLTLRATCPVVSARPAAWRWSFGLGGGKEGKANSMAMADAVLGGYSGLKSHDEADAVLLAWWGWKNVLEARQ